MLRASTFFGTIGVIAMGVVVFASGPRDVPVILDADTLQAIRAGGNCEYPSSAPDPCTTCTPVGTIFMQCDTPMGSWTCPWNPGQCVSCTLTSNMCPGIAYWYRTRDCPEGEDIQKQVCGFFFNSESIGYCPGTCF